MRLFVQWRQNTLLGAGRLALTAQATHPIDALSRRGCAWVPGWPSKGRTLHSRPSLCLPCSAVE